MRGASGHRPLNPARAPAPDRARLSIGCALGASLAFSINDIIIKSFSGSFPLHEVILVRALVALLLTVAPTAQQVAGRR